MSRIQRTDPELTPALEAFPPLILSREALPDIRAASAQMLEQMKGQLPTFPDVVTEDRRIPGAAGDPDVMVRVYRPRNPDGPLPGLLWIHGGGYVLGGVAQDDVSVKMLVTSVNAVIVSVEYRLAPETPFPGPLEDCYAALKWLREHARELGVDPARLAIGGASAGGGLAAGLGLLARDHGEVPLIFQLLIYPMIDDRNVMSAEEAGSDHHIWSRASNRFGWQAYLGDAYGTAEVPAHAAASRAEHLEGLPPTYISVGELDLFLHEDLDYAQRLMKAGVPTELHVYPAGWHAFDGLAPMSGVSQRFALDRDGALRRALHPQAPQPVAQATD